MMDDPLVLTHEDYRELAAFLEQQLPLCPTQTEADELRVRLARLYLGTLQDPDRAAAHAEQLLRSIEPLVTKDPGDDDLRARYIAIAKSCGAELTAAETLGRALKRAKDGHVRERVGFDVASLYLHEGELKEARSALREVLLVDAGGPCALAAARRLLDLEGEPGDVQVIGAALEVIAKASPDPMDRQEAATRLLSMHDSKPLKDSRLAVAFHALVDTARADEALAWLRTFHERKGDKKGLSDVYRRQALRARDPDLARSLALRSVELCSDESDAERVQSWLWFVEDFGPHRAAHAELIFLLEQMQRWAELCRVLEADVALAMPEERAALLARLGQTRLVRLADADGAIEAFAGCLSLEPSNAVARGAVESLMAAGDRRLAAADVLEPVYHLAQFYDGELRVIDTRAQLLPDPRARLVALAAAVDIAVGHLADLQQAMQLCARALGEALAFAADSVLDWLVVLQRVAGVSRQPGGQAAILLGLLGDGPIDSFERVAIALSAIDALLAAESPDQALALCRRAIAADASSPELLRRLDELLGDQEAPDARLARYEAALRQSSVPGRRSSLMHAIATIRGASLDDLSGAIDLWREILSEDPTDFAAHNALIEGTEKLGDTEAAFDLIDCARKSLRGHERNTMTLRKVRALLGRGAADRAMDLCRELIDETALGTAIVQAIAEIALDQDEPVLGRRALELLIAGGDLDVRKDALERLGNLVFEKSDDRQVAVASWKAAAQMCAGSPTERDRARNLYERILQTLPDDREVAAQLVELYGASGEWAKLPAAFRVLMRIGEDPAGCVSVLLGLEQSAVLAPAVDDFASLVDELAGRLGREAPEQIRSLKRAKARALASDSARQAEASQAYRELIEAFESEEDVRDFETFVASGASAAERHRDRRWLYAWRAEHDSRPAELLLEWAKAEEENGDPDAATAVYERLEQVANTLDDRAALRIFCSLLSGAGFATAASSGPRQRWLQRIIELSPADPPSALLAAVRGATELPSAVSLWEGAERIARDLGQPEVVGRAYHSVLVEQTVDPALAEILGRRMVAFEEELAIDSSRSIDALQAVLARAPGARWALDRVKLVLGSQARYGELFALFDRAIDVASDGQQRGDLLYEAAFAARDLAGEPERAIAYLESLHALRPDDGAVEGALERLYERQGRKVDLIELLGARMDRASGFKRRDLCQRVASLWLDLGDIERAAAVVEQMLSGEASVADVTDLLERIVERAPPDGRSGRRRKARPVDVVLGRAIQLLRGHYESAGRIDDVVRIAERSLSHAKDSDKRADCIRDLVRLRLRVAESGVGGFAPLFARIESDANGDPRLRSIAYKALLLASIGRLRRAATPARADAEDAAWRAIQELRAHLMQTGKVDAALRLVYRCSHLPLERGRRRELLREAALLCSERLQNPERATRIFAELYDDDGADDIAAQCLERFAELLYAAGQHARLASLWEQQAQIRAEGGEFADERACWERAADLWERHGAAEEAIGAYRRAAALGSEASFEALARIHSERHEWTEAAKALEWLYTHSSDAERGVRALGLVEAYVALGQRDRARACLEEVNRAPDTDPIEPVRERLIALYRQDEVCRPLARLLSSEARRTDDPARKLALLREAADLHRSKLDEPAEAAALLELAVALEPQDGALRVSLVDTLEGLARWDQAAAVLEAQIKLYGDLRSKDRALVHRRLAAALLRANRREDALAELRQAVEMHPAQPAILYDLARVALDAGDLDLSEATYRTLLLAGHRPTEDAAGTAPQRAGVFADLSEIALRNGDAARAADWVDSAFEEAVERGSDPRAFEHRLLARGRHDLLAHALVRRAQRGATLTDRAVALGELVEVWTQHLGRSVELGTRIRQQAERIARDLDHEDLTDASAWAALSTAHASLGGDDGAAYKLASLLETAIPKASPGPARSRLRVLRARALLGQTTQPAGVSVEAAIAELSNALAEDPAGLDAIDLLSDVLEREGRSEELVAVLESRLHSLSGFDPVQAKPTGGSPEGSAHEIVEAAWRLGRALERVGRSRDALPVYEFVLDLPATHREIVSSLVGRLQELGSQRAADCLERWIAMDADAPLEAVKRLVEVRDGQGDAAGAIRALEAGFSGHPAEADLRDRLVQKYEDRAEWAQAVKVLGRAVDLAPSDRPLLLRLIEACRRVGLDQEALRALDGAVAARATSTAMVDAELLGLRARARERVADYEGALSDLESASLADPAYVNPLIELFGRMASAADSSGAGANRHTIRLVDTLVRMKRPKQARRELDRLLARVPNHGEGLSRLASLAAAEGNWNSAAQAYRKVLLVAERRSNREQLARVAIATAEACQRAGGLGEARDALVRALEVLSRGATPVPELERLCQAMKEWGRLANLLVARAEQQENPDAKIDLLVRAARLLLEDAADPEGALRAIEPVAAMRPESVEVLLLRARAQVVMGQVPQALAVLYDVVERNRGKRSPMLANLYLEIGKAHLAVDELVEAFDALESAFGVDWRAGDVAMLLGLVALDLEQEKTAERAFSAVTTLPPRKEASGPGADAATKAIAFYHLASMALAKGDLAKARRLAAKAVGGNPAHIAARTLLERLELTAVEGAPGK
jgi:tetratricopeptide (TPR) repeat protein